MANNTKMETIMRIKLFIFSLLALMVMATSTHADTSTINPVLPATGSSITSSVLRSQFSAAYNDINTLYSRVDYLDNQVGGLEVYNPANVSITGGIITGIIPLAVDSGGTGASSASGARTNLGLVIGTNVQAYNATLDALGNVSAASDKCPYFTGAATASVFTCSSYGRSLMGAADASAFAGLLGLGTMAFEDAGDFVQAGDLAAVATSGQWDDIAGKPSFAAVATSGAYTDLTGEPTKIFSTIAVSGQSNVVADNTDDTLTLIAGSNTEITTAGNSVTIRATGSIAGTTTATNVSFDPTGLAHTDATDVQELGEDFDAAITASGDVFGPASATDNALARFDLTTGKLIKNSVVIVDNSGNTSGMGTLASAEHTITSASATALAVGPNGTSNPSFIVNASTPSAATGIEIFSAVSGGGVQINATGGTNEDINIRSKGGGNANLTTMTSSGSINLRPNATTRYTFSHSAATFSPAVGPTAATTRFLVNAAADTGLTAGAEAPWVLFDGGVTRQHASNTAITTQRDFRIEPSTHSFQTATGTITTASTVYIGGPPVAGTNAAITNPYALYVNSGNSFFGGNVTATTFVGAHTGNSSTATALAANGTNCSAGQFPLGVDAGGNSETCTALPTTISGTTNEIAASASTGAVTLSLPSTVSLASKTFRVPQGTSLPGTCTVGDSFMDTDATTGQRWYLCESTNTWSVQGDGGGGGGAPTDATYITQTANGSLSAEQALSSLSTGIMRVATTTGVITSLTDSSGISSNISDETGSGALVFATSPVFTTPNIGSATGSISGNAGTATALQTGRTIAITGDLAYTSPSFDGSGNVTASGTLASVNANVGSFTAANITVNAKGLITAAANGTAPTPTVITVADTTDSTSFCALFESATGDLGPKTDAGCTYDASSGTLVPTILSTATITLTGTGTLNGLDAVDATGEDTIEALIFDADAQNITGVWEVADDTNFDFGTDADWHIEYDEGVDNQLLFTTTNTSAIATTDPMFEVLVGTTPTANQQVFGLAKGTQATNTALFTVDAEGDGIFTGSLGLTGTLTFGGTGNLTDVDAINSTTEATFEAALDIGGDVTSTGMSSTNIAAGVIVNADVNASAAIAHSKMATALKTLFIPATAMKPTTTNGCAALATVEISSSQPEVYSLDCNPSTDEKAQFQFVPPKGWNNGTITYSLNWSHAATTTNFATVWGMECLAVSNDDTIGAAYGTAVTVTDTGGTTNDLYITPTSTAVTIGGTPADADEVFCRVYRDADNGSDTMAIDGRLMGVTIYYTQTTADDT